eukprot:m.448518 g.448518  ORF g.448518 m.448518 type:complete len:282 (+) comp20315_c14_seq41:8291-9136(+)
MEGEVRRCQHRLQELVAGSDMDERVVLDVFKTLESQSMTMALLQATKIGKTVNVARKKCSVGGEAATLARTIIAKWKQLVPSDGSKTPSTPTTPTVKTAKPNSNEETAATTAKLCRFAATGDPARDSCRKMVSEVLAKKPTSGDLRPGKVAEQIEVALFDSFKAANEQYKKRVRRSVSNLRANEKVRGRLLCGELQPSDFITMSSEDLMTEAMMRKKSVAQKTKREEARLALKQGATSDQIPCPKCRAKDCQFTEMQTRSADEPMTVFCACNKCGNRWKFC